jgi:hypothetical protein
MFAWGLYRTRDATSGAEYALVDYGNAPSLKDTISRSHYQMRGYRPAFDTLPTQEQYNDAQQKAVGEAVAAEAAKSPQDRD